MPLTSVENAIADIQSGKLLIIVDDESRENEGDLVVAAEKVTPEIINFMISEARGLLCVPMLGKRLDELNIPMMVTAPSASRFGTAFTVSVDHISNSTGISAHERANTIIHLIDPSANSTDFLKPGHLFPLRYEDGGVLVRAGHTEAIIDLAKLSNVYPAGAICEMVSSDGTMARLSELEVFSKKFGINIVSIAQIIDYRRKHEKLVERVADAALPTQYGTFRSIVYTSVIAPGEHIALTKGDWGPTEPVIVRVHDECLTGEAFKSLRCDCRKQMDMALQLISDAQKGVFIYMRQEGRGIGLHNKIRAYSLQDDGMDTVDANLALGFEPDLRQYGIGAQILIDLGITKMKLLTNNPRKVAGLSGWGLEVTDTLPLEAPLTPQNSSYLKTKKNRMGHTLNLPDE